VGRHGGHPSKVEQDFVEGVDYLTMEINFLTVRLVVLSERGGRCVLFLNLERSAARCSLRWCLICRGLCEESRKSLKLYGLNRNALN